MIWSNSSAATIQDVVGSGPNTIWTDSVANKSDGSSQKHPHLNYSQAELSLAAELLRYEVKSFDPFTGTEIPVYDRIDAFYLPVAGSSRPRPKISIYHIDSP